MKHLFVPYEIALELKEKGFYEPCFAYYHDGRITGVNKWDRKDWEFHILTNNEITAVTVEIILAPLYQQVIDWFREKHGFEFNIGRHMLDDPHSYRITIYDYPNEELAYNQNVSKEPYYNTYYDALNKAIEESIKLI